MRLVHLTSSTFYGGPERQMLGLARALPDHVSTTFISFSEGGRCAAFLSEVRSAGFPAFALNADFPRLVATHRELTALLQAASCDVVLCHGYKANILGRLAARWLGKPAVAVSRGWTGENRRVRCYEWLDRRHLRFMDHVVCVSDGQAAKVSRWCGIPMSRLSVIRNSARLAAFEHRDPAARERLHGFFPQSTKVQTIVLAAGRLSPEKGFDVLVEAASIACREHPNVGVVLFGEGPLRGELEQQVSRLGLAGRFVMPGFRSDLDSLIGAADLVVLPSFTEGLPNVALEASAAGVPVAATAVGGTPEVVIDGETGLLAPPGQPEALAAKMGVMLGDGLLRKRFGEAGRRAMRTRFTFEAQARAYVELIDRIIVRPSPLVLRPSGAAADNVLRH